MELGHWLSNPLLVPVVAAFLGSWLLPQITRQWQDHQKALEIQTALVSEMSEAVSTLPSVPAASSPRDWLPSRRPTRAPSSAPGTTGTGVLTSSSASIGAKLRAYFGPGVGGEWQSFTYVVTDFLLLSAKPGPEAGASSRWSRSSATGAS